jgi:hypothetical protein
VPLLISSYRVLPIIAILIFDPIVLVISKANLFSSFHFQVFIFLNFQVSIIIPLLIAYFLLSLILFTV